MGSTPTNESGLAKRVYFRRKLDRTPPECRSEYLFVVSSLVLMLEGRPLTKIDFPLFALLDDVAKTCIRITQIEKTLDEGSRKGEFNSQLESLLINLRKFRSTLIDDFRTVSGKKKLRTTMTGQNLNWRSKIVKSRKLEAVNDVEKTLEADGEIHTEEHGTQPAGQEVA